MICLIKRLAAASDKRSAGLENKFATATGATKPDNLWDNTCGDTKEENVINEENR